MAAVFTFESYLILGLIITLKLPLEAFEVRLAEEVLFVVLELLEAFEVKLAEEVLFVLLELLEVFEVKLAEEEVLFVLATPNWQVVPAKQIVQFVALEHEEQLGTSKLQGLHTPLTAT